MRYLIITLLLAGCTQVQVTRDAAMPAWTDTTPPGDCSNWAPNLFCWRGQCDMDSPYCWLPGHPWLPGDVNFDGVVNTIDLIHVRNSCMNRPVEPDPARGWYFDCSLADLNGDGVVNIFDLIEIRKHLNESVPMAFVDGRWQ